MPLLHNVVLTYSGMNFFVALLAIAPPFLVGINFKLHLQTLCLRAEKETIFLQNKVLDQFFILNQ